jgi:hypothetical protein
MTRRLAMIACHECGTPAELRETKKGRLHYHCAGADCGHQFFSRSMACDKRLAQRATEWADTTRRAELGANPRAPVPAPPKPSPPVAPPAPAPKPTPGGSWLDRPLF